MKVNSLHWHLSITICYMYCVLDVLASTSSIIHLLLISMDRLFNLFLNNKFNKTTFGLKILF